MTLLKDMLTPAASGLTHLLPLLIIFVLFIHIYFITVLFASSGLSLAFRKKEDELRDKLSGLFFGKPLTVLLFSILPLLMLPPLYRLTFFESELRFEQYLTIALIVLTTGLVFLYTYKKKKIFAGGALGTLALLLYLSLFSVVLSLFIYPERWPFIKALFPYPLFAVTPLFLIIILVSVSFINTGSAMGFLLLSWKEKKLPDNSLLSAPVSKLSRYLILAGTLMLPPALFLLLFTLPGYSVGSTIFPSAILLLLFTVLSAIPVFPLFRKKEERKKDSFTFAFIISLLLTFTLSVLLFSFQKYSNIDRMALAEMVAEKKAESIEAARMEIYSKSMKISTEYGEQIYKERCTACHDFEKTILGPSFNSVIPKYADNPDNMVKFILNPVKINPSLPSMPDPGLTTLQAKSVTKYILEKDKKSNGEQSE